jgi:hypothetical protein
MAVSRLVRVVPPDLLGVPGAMDRVPARIRFFAAASFAQGRQIGLVRPLRKGINENGFKTFGFKPEDRLCSILLVLLTFPQRIMRR